MGGVATGGRSGILPVRRRLQRPIRLQDSLYFPWSSSDERALRSRPHQREGTSRFKERASSDGSAWRFRAIISTCQRAIYETDRKALGCPLLHPALLQSSH